MKFNDMAKLSPVSIVFDHDSQYVFSFWKSFQQSMGTKLSLRTPFIHKLMDSLSAPIQTLVDMLRASVLDFGSEWDDYLALCEFVYNNNYHLDIYMAPFEALYGRSYRTPIYWDVVDTKSFHGPTIISDITENVQKVRELKIA